MSRKIPVYQAEVDCGLSEQIQASASIVYASQVEFNASEVVPVLSKKVLARATNENQLDLAYLTSCLTTIGWNKNDDVFDKIETWNARSTPEDKPINYEHDCKDIIGHITGSYVVGSDAKLIADDTSVDKLPDAFKVMTTGVLYKYWADKTALERMQNIIAEIVEGKWFVSMEALFDDFNYAVVDAKGKNRVIARTRESAFLTKYLRAYGGKGVFEGAKIGRVLKNIIFSGKGLTMKPANPSSSIDQVIAFEKALATSVEEFIPNSKDTGYTLSNKMERVKMADTQIEFLQAENKRLENTCNQAIAKQQEIEKRLQDMNEQAVKSKMEAFATDIKTRDEKITSLTNQVETEQKARTEAQAKLAEKEKCAAELQAKLDEQTVAAQKNARISVVAAELSMDAKAAETFYNEEFLDLKLSDERFNKLVATFKKSKASTPAKVEPTAAELAKAAEEAKAKADAETADAAKKVLENAQATEAKTAKLGVDGVGNTVEQTRANLSAFLAKTCLRKTTAK